MSLHPQVVSIYCDNIQSKHQKKKKKKANLAILPKPSQGNLVVISSIKQYKFLQHRTLKKEIKKKTIETSCS